MASKKTSSNNIVMSTASPARKRTERARSVKPVETPSLTGSTAAVEQVTTLASAPTQDEIASLAYLYWEARGCQGGSPEEDWIRAERELRARPLAAHA
jgi:hypothetical protein